MKTWLSVRTSAATWTQVQMKDLRRQQTAEVTEVLREVTEVTEARAAQWFCSVVLIHSPHTFISQILQRYTEAKLAGQSSMDDSDG